MAMKVIYGVILGLVLMSLSPVAAQEQPTTQGAEPVKAAPNAEFDKANPTALTTELVRREIFLLREILEAEVKGNTDLNRERIVSALGKLETRLDGMDKAIVLLQVRADKVPTETDIAVTNNKTWVQAKLDDITNRLSTASETALQKEAVNKSAINDALVAVKQQGDKQNEFTSATATKTENTFSKQVSGLQDIVVLNKGNNDRQLTDLTERLSKIEGLVGGLGAIQSTVAQLNDRFNRTEGNASGSSDNSAFIISMIAVAATIISMLGTGVAVVMSTRKPDQPYNGNGNGGVVYPEPRRK